MQIVWLSSYPKSGNTWLRFLLYNYLFGDVGKSEDISKRIPDIHDVELQTLPDPGNRQALLCKTHFLLNGNHRYLESTTAFIHVIRHPKDVLLSNLNFLKMSGNVDERTYCADFIRWMGVRHWRELGMGSWVEHTASWLAGAGRMPHLFLRYEQMKADTTASMERIVRFLNLPFDQARIEQAVHASNFENVRRLEEAERKGGISSKLFVIGHGERADAANRFMNRGKCGQDLNHISPALNESFDNRFRDVLELLGYA